MTSTKTYVGLACVTAATMFVEIVLTRIFSVILWYHFAFVAISLAMLGMAGGAMYVYLRRDQFPAAGALQAISRLTGLFGGAVVLAYVLALGVAFRLESHPVAFVSLGLIVGFWGVPFFLSGMIVSIALTRTNLPVGRLYAVDLVGAALGCLLVQPALSVLGPPASLGLTGLLLVMVATWTDADGAREMKFSRAAGLTMLACFTALCYLSPALFSPTWVKGEWERTPEQVRWNAYSRIAVFPAEDVPPSGWGMGSKLKARQWPKITTHYENIDATAATWITRVNGDFAQHRYLAYDVTNVPYALRETGNVAVVGVGGGRDILSAEVLGRHQITGIELNAIFVRLLKQDYAAFSGGLVDLPNVRLVNAEARNWLERTSDRFDLIQISLIDTWAATASGAFALSENTLYTRDAWRTFLTRLTPGGLLSVSRWYCPDAPAEAYRLTTLARATLTSLGVAEPRRCVALIANEIDVPLGVVTMLVSRTPLTPGDCRKLDEAAARFGFHVLCSPTHPNREYVQLLDPRTAAATESAYMLDISAPTDNRPFFFHMIRPRDLFAVGRWHEMVPRNSPQHQNLFAVLILGTLGFMLTIAAVALTIAPLSLELGRGVWRRHDILPAVYFAAIGLGFMLVEMAIIQRTGIMLGHPVYGLQVTLFSLLLGSGLGSLLSTRLARAVGKANVLLAVVVATAAAVLALGPLAAHLSSAPQPLRIGAVGLLVFAIGLLMGMPFPTGLDSARERSGDDLLPWLWGVNGVFSVLGAFLATAGGLFGGAQITGFAGVACYLIACLTLWRLTTGNPTPTRQR